MNCFRTIALTAALTLGTALAGTMAAHADDLRIALDGSLDTLDPTNSTNNSVASVSSGVGERLIGFDKDMNLTPLLATSWEANEEATEFTFHLRPDVLFQDGTPFNAEAVKYNVMRLADPESKVKRGPMLRIVKSVDVIDDLTVKLNLDKPFGAMLATMAHPSIVMLSPKALGNPDIDPNKNPVGTGPFKVVEWIPGEHVKLEKFDRYWDKGWPKVDNVEYLIVNEASTSVSMLRSGEVEFIYIMPPALVGSFEGSEEFKILEVPGITVWTASMNLMKKEFQDPRVREAFNLAVDKEAFNQVVFSGHGQIPTSPLAPNTAFYSAQEAYPYDLERAKALMKEAGYENGFSIEAWSRNNTSETQMLQFLQQQLSQINVAVKIMPLEAATRSEKVFGKVDPKTIEFGLLIGGWSPSTGDADWHLRPVYATEGWIPSLYNMAFYSNPDVDAEIEKGLASADPAVRGEAYANAQAQIWKDKPVIWLSADSKISAARSNLSGVYPMPDGTMSYVRAAFE